MNNQYCYIKFQSLNDDLFMRLVDFNEALIREKNSDEMNEKELINLLGPKEKEYFWNPDEDELREWQNHWEITPVEIRTSPNMNTPQWDVESMLSAFSNGEYELIGIEKKNDYCYYYFYSFSYPYGGVDCMVVLIEAFGHRVIGIYNGCEYYDYVPREHWCLRIPTPSDSNAALLKALNIKMPSVLPHREVPVVTRKKLQAQRKSIEK